MKNCKTRVIVNVVYGLKNLNQKSCSVFAEKTSPKSWTTSKVWRVMEQSLLVKLVQIIGSLVPYMWNAQPIM